LNRFFKKNDIPYADFYNKMMDENGILKECAYIDGLHFSIKGYKQMDKVIFQYVLKNNIWTNFF